MCGVDEEVCRSSYIALPTCYRPSLVYIRPHSLLFNLLCLITSFYRAVADLLLSNVYLPRMERSIYPILTINMDRVWVCLNVCDKCTFSWPVSCTGGDVWWRYQMCWPITPAQSQDRSVVNSNNDMISPIFWNVLTIYFNLNSQQTRPPQVAKRMGSPCVCVCLYWGSLLE